VNNRRWQAAANFIHLRRETGPEIAITTVVHAPADVRS
jgi:hypothetical protein